MIEPHITVKTLASILALIGMIAVGVLFAEDRYVKTEGIRHMQQSIEQRVDKSVLQMRKWSIEDRLMQIEVKPELKRTNMERAIAARYQRELDLVNSEIANLPK